MIAAEGELSYAELDRAADRLAAGLAHNGVQRGDRVAILLPNALEAVIAIYGIFRAGAAISPLNPTVKARKLAYVLDDSGARALICDDERVETAREAAERAAGDVHVFSERRVGADGRGGPAQAALGRPRRGHLHLGLDRGAEGRRRSPTRR